VPVRECRSGRASNGAPQALTLVGSDAERGGRSYDCAVTPAVGAVRLASGVSLSLAATGDRSGPPVLLLPGPTDSWHSYGPVLERVPASIHAIAVSQRDHGDSDKPRTGYHVEDFAADVPLLLDALGIERAVLAGHSRSCLVARRVALDHPERVAGLVLEASPTTLRGHAGLADFMESVVSGLHDPTDPAFARTFLADTSCDGLAADFVDDLVNELGRSHATLGGSPSLRRRRHCLRRATHVASGAVKRRASERIGRAKPGRPLPEIDHRAANVRSQERSHERQQLLHQGEQSGAWPAGGLVQGEPVDVRIRSKTRNRQPA